mgnify:CR=1 FL=1
MGLLDANTPQIQTSSAGTSDMASMMRGTMARAEGTAQQAMAYHQGESSMAFQTAHARFVEAAAKANSLLDIASANMREAGATYQTQDAAGASDYNAASGAIPSGNL